MQARRKRRVFSKEFKKELVELYNQGKPRKEIIKEYELTPSAFDKWVQQFNQSDTSLENEAFVAVQNEVEKLQREIGQLQNENRVLKEAVMIFVRKT